MARTKAGERKKMDQRRKAAAAKRTAASQPQTLLEPPRPAAAAAAAAAAALLEAGYSSDDSTCEFDHNGDIISYRGGRHLVYGHLPPEERPRVIVLQSDPDSSISGGNDEHSAPE